MAKKGIRPLSAFSHTQPLTSRDVYVAAGRRKQRGTSERPPNPALPDGSGTAIRHCQLVAESASRRPLNVGHLNSQIVPENRAESDSSHVFPEYSQLVPDRTQGVRALSSNATRRSYVPISYIMSS